MKKLSEISVYYYVCAGIIYTMIFWTYLNSILCILLVLYWLFFTKKQFSLNTARSRLILIFISFFLVALISVAYSTNISGGLAEMGRKSPLLFFPLIFGTSGFLTSDLSKKITVHIIIATSLACLIGIGYGIVRSITLQDIELMTGRNILLFHALRAPYMGIFCLLSVVLALNLYPGASKQEARWLMLSVAIVSLMVFLLGIRLIIFSWFIIVIYYAWKYFKNPFYRLSVFSGIILLIIASTILNPKLSRQWKELVGFSSGQRIELDKDASLGKSWGGLALRRAIWQCSADILEKHWLTGVGTGDVQDALQQSYENRQFYFASRYNKYNAHNQYLQSWLAAGLPGLLSFLSALLIPLLMYRKYFKGEVYFMFLAVFLTIAVTESLLDSNKGILCYSFLNSIFAFSLLKQFNKPA